MPLEIEVYNAEEERHRHYVGYTEYAAYSTKTFDDFRFPSKMISDDQLFRFVDWYNEQDIQRLEPGLFFRDAALETNYTMDEVQLLSRISRAVLVLTERYCKKRVGVYFNHQGSVGMFRVVQAISRLAKREALSVFEVGPGCGYTGSLIAMAGHTYVSYDVAQGYYIWQSRLLEELFPDEFTELAANPGANLSKLSRVGHIPWWIYMSIYKDMPISADVVISNANLGEMNIDSLRYVLRVSSLMLRKSEIGLFIFANPGACHINSELQIELELEKAGFEKVLSEKVYGFVPSGKEPPMQIVEKLEAGIPLYDPDGLGKTFAIRDFIDFENAELAEEFYYNSFLYDWPNLSNTKT